MAGNSDENEHKTIFQSYIINHVLLTLLWKLITKKKLISSTITVFTWDTELHSGTTVHTSHWQHWNG